MTADFEFTSPQGKEGHRKIGWMVRENLNDDAVHFTATVHGDGLTVAQWRVLRGAYMRDPQDEQFFPKKKHAPYRSSEKARLILCASLMPENHCNLWRHHHG